MKAPKGYREAQAYTGETKKLTPGGHLIRLRTVEDTANQDGSEYLRVQFDIEEGGEFDGFYRDAYGRRVRYDVNADWPGRMSVFVYDREGNTSGRFKGFIQAVEQSNPGYSFEASGFNEQTLQGKIVGAVFGEDEYEFNGNHGTTVRIRYCVPVAKVREGVPVPPFRPLKQDGARGAAPAAAGIGYSDELPF